MAPTTTASSPEQIPAVLRSQPRWCAWRVEKNPAGKLTKRPDRSTRNVQQCLTFGEVAQLPRDTTSGIGFVVTGGVFVGEKKHALVFLDLDSCVANGEVRPWAMAVVNRLRSYTEYSPSGTGLRVVVAIPGLDDVRHWRSKVNVPDPGWTPTEKAPNIQLFGTGAAGYLTMTGRPLSQETSEVRLVNLTTLESAVPMLVAAPANVAPVATTIAPAVPSEIITKIVAATEKGRALIRGDWREVTPHQSASEAYSVLVAMVLRATHGDVDATVSWLLGHTAWGAGQIDDSADPGRYARESWVRKDVGRAAASAPTAGFEALALPAPAQPPTGGPAAPPGAPEVEEPASGRPADVVAAWAAEGPLQRLPTGIPTLDAMTGGGLVLGSRVYMIGAPDAGKTLLALQIVDAYLTRGVPVAILGVDEEPGDLATRFLQRRGVSRAAIESRDPAVLETARQALAAVPLLLFDGATSIEAAAVAVHRLAVSRYPGVDRPPCVLMIDSLQTARAEGDNLNDSLYRLVTQRVQVIRAAATRYRCLVLTTSEMSRSAYRSKNVADQSADMAVAKESGAVEYSARVLLSLRNVPNSSDVVELRLVKNKHGLSHRVDQPGIYLRVDRARQHSTEDAAFEAPDVDTAKTSQSHTRLTQDAAMVAMTLVAADLGRNALSDLTGLPRRRIDAVREWLLEVGAVVETPPKDGKPTSPKLLQLVPSKLPESVSAAMRCET